jgi:hypothetical protein
MSAKDEVSLGDVASSALGSLALMTGYLGSLCLFLAALSTFFAVPFLGQLTYLNGPTGSGFVYLLCAALSVYVTYTRRFFLLYLTGGLSAVMAGYDVLNGTRLGYVIQMTLGGGLTPSMGGAPDPILTGMMQDTGFSIPTTWMMLAAGIFILVITPNLAQKEPEEVKATPKSRDDILEKRMSELDNLITIYERGHITKEEFTNLKNEIIGKKLK